MARFDVFRFEGGYVLDVQADQLTRFETRVVVPLLPDGSVPTPMPRMHPVFDIGGSPHVMATHLLSAVPRALLGRPVCSVSEQQDTITQALDVLLTGF